MQFCPFIWWYIQLLGNSLFPFSSRPEVYQLALSFALRSQDGRGTGDLLWRIKLIKSSLLFISRKLSHCPLGISLEERKPFLAFRICYPLEMESQTPSVSAQVQPPGMETIPKHGFESSAHPLPSGWPYAFIHMSKGIPPSILCLSCPCHIFPRSLLYQLKS